MSRVRARSPVVWVTLPALLAGCQRVAVPPPPPPTSVAPCPAPRIDTADWVSVADSAGVSYRLPAEFAERLPRDLPYRQWTAGVGRVSIGFSPSQEHWLTLRRVPSPGMHEMAECIDALADRQILLQSWRAENGVFREGRRFDLFEMMALVQVEPMLTLFVTGGSSDPGFQALLLAVARTVEVR